MLCLAIHLCRVLRPRQRRLWSWRWQQSRQALKNDINTILVHTSKSLISTLTTRGRRKLHSGAWRRSRCRSLPSEGRRGRSTWASWISTCSWTDHRMLLHIIFFCCKNQTNQTFSCQTYPTRCQPQTYQQQILLNWQCHCWYYCPLFAELNSISGISAYI